jgi:hypothetical protein
MEFFVADAPTPVLGGKAETGFIVEALEPLKSEHDQRSGDVA